MLRDEPAETAAVKVEVLEDDDAVGVDDRGGDEIKMKIKFETKPRRHEVAGGRTDEELEAFYRGVHGKLAAHYPGTRLLVKEEHRRGDDKMANLKREVNQRLKQETKEEEEKMSEDEEEKELEREEEEMDEVEAKEGEEEEGEGKEREVVVKVEAATPQRRNPDRRKRAKVEIKLEQDDGNDDDDGEVVDAGGADDEKARGKPTTPAKAAAGAVAAAAVAAMVMPKEGSKEKKKTNVCGGQKTVLASLISTVLSQNTTDRNSSAAWANLQRAYNGDWERVRTAKPSQLVDVIRTGGLAQRKGGIIQGLLNQLYEERDGELSLEHLRDLPTEEVKQELTKYKGIGPKTASCVLMFNMKRADFPVDTHVHRVSTRLGFVRGTTREQTYEFMNATMPDEIKRDMHVLLIRHGKQVCKARGPKCGECVLRDDCRYGQTLKKQNTKKTKKELKLGDDDEEEEEAVDDEEVEEEKKKKTSIKRRSLSTAGRGGKSKKGTKMVKREDDDDDDAFEVRKTKLRTRGVASSSVKRVAKRRRSAPASIGDIEDAV